MRHTCVRARVGGRACACVSAGGETTAGLSHQVLQAVAAATSGTVGFAVSESLLRLLPPYLSTSLHDLITATGTRAVVHALAPALMHTLSFPENVATNRLCFQCGRFGKPEACAGCPQWHVEHAKLQGAYYYLNFYADYYTDYYAQVFTGTEFEEEEEGSAMPGAAAGGTAGAV